MPEPDWSFSNRWLSAMTINPETSKFSVDKVIDRLADACIEARRVWKLMQLQPVFKAPSIFP